jgi:hypothetical protein
MFRPQGSNLLEGEIPSSMGNLVNIITMELGTYCKLLSMRYGTRFENLTLFTLLENNFLTGSIPEAFENMSNLQKLNLHRNYITGDLDSILCNRNESLLELTADCNPDLPEVACSCCTMCFLIWCSIGPGMLNSQEGETSILFFIGLLIKFISWLVSNRWWRNKKTANTSSIYYSD